MMKTSTVLRPQSTSTSILTHTHLPNSTLNPPFFIKTTKLYPICRAKSRGQDRPISLETKPRIEKASSKEGNEESGDGCSRLVTIGAVSVGLVLLGMGMDEHKALAFGPEGPLMEEFWDNVRRYALYALTVSSGALYTVLQPIGELLKNPISAILVVVIFGGSFYIMSQVLNAMVGVTNFSYDYSY